MKKSIKSLEPILISYMALSCLIFLHLCFTTLNATPFNQDQDKTHPQSGYLPPIKLPLPIIQLLETHHWEKALEKLTELYQAPHSDPNLKYYLAYCYEQQAVLAFSEKRFKDAAEQLESASQYVNDVPDIYLGLAASYFSLSQYNEALSAYSRVIDIQPHNYTAHRMLGEIYYIMNQSQDAEKHWEKALELKPNDEYIKKRLASLKKLNRLTGDFETEIDVLFSVTFNGQQNPQLRQLVLNMLDDISHQVGLQLGFYPRRQVPVVLLSNVAFFDITQTPQWTGGVYEGQIKIPVDQYHPQLLQIVLAHEYVHAVLFDRLSYRCPWWLNEGLAQYLSGDDKGNAAKLTLAAQLISSRKNIPTLDSLPGKEIQGNNPKKVQIAYALSLSAVQYFIDRFGMNQLQHILELMTEGKDFKTAINEVTGISFAQFQEDWQASIYIDVD